MTPYPAARAFSVPTGPQPVSAAALLPAADHAPPLSVLTYRLAAPDVAAWIASRRAARRAGRALVASALLAGMMGLQVLSGRLPVPPGPAFALLEAGVIMMLPVALALWTRRRGHLAEAREMMPQPVTVRLAVWPDRLELTEGTAPGTRPQVITPRRLHRLHLTRRHLLGETETARLIVPRAAFADRAAMRALAERLQHLRDGR